MKKIGLILLANYWMCLAIAQNVGIGIANPADNLHLHVGSGASASISFTNTSVGTIPDNGMRIGMLYEGANLSNRYGFINLRADMPFNIFQGTQRRFTIGSTGNVGIGMAPYNFATLNVNGYGYFFAKPSEGAFVAASDTNTTASLTGSGFGASKRLSTGLNFINLLMRGDKPQAYIEANFKNGTANQGVSTVVFDSLGRVGIGSYILDSILFSRLQVFGSQTIQQGTLYLHGHRNNYTQGSEIRFQYNGFADNAAGPLSGQSWYSIEHEDADDPTTNRQNTLAIVRNNIHPNNQIFNTRYVGFALNNLGQVGIGRYPDKALAGDVDVQVSGKMKISGAIQLDILGAAAGKLLVSNASGDASWQNPSRITLDQPSATGQSVLEFRNQGVYVGGFGWSEASARYFLYDGPTNTNPLLIKNGRIGIGNREPTTNTLEVNGNASKATAGDWLANSDARLKKEIAPLKNALEKLLQLKGVTYEWNDDKTGTKRPAGKQMGFTAQNIQQVFPQLVSTDAQGFLQTSYGTYDALYVEAIKELLQKIQVLEKKIQALQQ
jgi:Chaperone of endosialidase